MVSPATPHGGASFGELTPWGLIQRTWKQVTEHELIMRASAITYYALTAFVPFLAVLVTIAAHMSPHLGGGANSRDITGTVTVEEFRSGLSRFLPPESYEVVAGEIARLQAGPHFGLISVGLGVSLWLASGLFGTFIQAVNIIHGVRETRSYRRLTLTAIILALLEVMIVLGTLLALVVWPKVRGVFGWEQIPRIGEIVAEWSIVTGGLLLSFATTRYLGPNVHRRWKWVTTGSVGGTVALLAAGLLLRVYVQHFGGYGKTYGSLAGVMLLSFWFWISAIILLVSIQLDKLIEDAKENTQP